MEKRLCSVLIPYRKAERGLEVFLQRRDVDAATHPDEFSFFGGGVEEGETPEQALEREIQEELCLCPAGYRYLGLFESAHTRRHIFELEVDSNFESRIQVREGQYGKFFTAAECASEPKITETDKGFLKGYLSGSTIGEKMI